MLRDLEGRALENVNMGGLKEGASLFGQCRLRLTTCFDTL